MKGRRNIEKIHKYIGLLQEKSCKKSIGIPFGGHEDIKTENNIIRCLIPSKCSWTKF